MTIEDTQITIPVDIEVRVSRMYQTAETERIWLRAPNGQRLQLPVSVVTDIINCCRADIEHIEETALQEEMSK